MLQIDIVARIYPNMLEISSIMLPSLLQPISPANELARIKARRYNAIFMSVGNIINKSTIIRMIPIFDRRYSILAPAVLNDSPMLPPIIGMICDANILAVLDERLSAFDASKLCVEITVVNMSIMNPKKKDNVFFIALLKANKFPSLTNADDNVRAIHIPIISSSEMMQMFSKIDKKTIKP